MGIVRHASGGSLSGPFSPAAATTAPKRGDFVDRFRAPSLAGWGRVLLEKRAPPLRVGHSSLPAQTAPTGVPGVRSEPGCVPSANTRAGAGLHERFSLTSPAQARVRSVVGAAVGASGPLPAVAFCGDALGGLLGSPRLGFHSCHPCRSDPRSLRSSKLVRRSRPGWTPSEKEDKAMVFNVKEPLGRATSR